MKDTKLTSSSSDKGTVKNSKVSVRLNFLKRHKGKKKWNTEKPKGEQKDTYAEKVNEHIYRIKNVNDVEMTSNERCIRLNKTIKNSTRTINNSTLDIKA